MSADAGAIVVPSGWTRAQRLKNALIVVLVRCSLAIVRPLPYAVLCALGRAVGRLAWLLARSARARAIENVARAFPDRTGAEQAALARASFVELGHLLGDTLALLRPDERASSRLAWSPGAREALERARVAGRGVILITGHLGPWERLAAAIVEAGIALTTPVRASYDPRLEARVHAPLRRGRGVDAIDRDAPGTPRALVRALRANAVTGFLIDVNTRVASVRIPFFGRPAWTPSGPARLALRTGAPVVAAFATRDGIVVDEVRPACPPRADVTDADVEALVEVMSGHVERAIAREPDRWIWMHDRFGPRRAP